MPQNFDGSEYLDLSKPRLDYNCISIDKSTIPEAEVRLKLAKNRNWQVCKSEIDLEKKEFIYECMLNAKEIVRRTISFAEACDDYHWENFRLVNNNQSIKWKADQAWLDEVERVMSNTNKPIKRLRKKKST